MSIFNKQYRYIHCKKWKYLIILDACRYDCFKDNWDYTNIIKVKSPASTTYNFMQKMFPYYYNYTIYSANPFINSKDLGHWRYNSSKHFNKIINIFIHFWDEEKGTVIPETMYYVCKNAEHKSILWFLQPHSPYICLNSGISYEQFLSWKPKDSMFEKNDKIDYVFLKKCYIDNIKRVIPVVRKLIDELDKPIIITSDHAELFGEYGVIGHPDLNVPELRNVPLIYIGE